MGQQALASMTADEFFAWQETQDELYELVDGQPMQMMAGAKRRHDQVTINLIVAVDARLRGKSCQPTTQDTAIQISATQIRRPDLAIDCGPFADEDYVAPDPRAVFEVLSRSTRIFDHTKKLEEYKSLASLRHIVLIDPDSPQVIAFQRSSDNSWASLTITGLDTAIDFADLGFNLLLRDNYRDLVFRVKPLLVAGAESRSG